MARLLLVPPTAHASGFDHLVHDYEILRASAEAPIDRSHTLVDSPQEAQVVLFVGSRDPLHRDVRRHPVAKAHPERTVLYDSNDWFIPFLRGIYPSVRRSRYRSSRMRGGHYLRWSDSEAIQFTDPRNQPTFLFGFTGAVDTHPIRSRLLSLKSPGALLRDSSRDPGRGFSQPPEVYEAYKARYAEELSAVLFVLCPRGVGASSMRIFEAMKAGRVPVVVSDDWVPPPGPDWARISLRVPEAEVGSIPVRLEQARSRGSEMGRRAREAWERWFSPKASFGTFASVSEQLVASPWGRERIDRLLVHIELLQWYALRHVIAGPALRRVMRKTKRQTE